MFSRLIEESQEAEPFDDVAVNHIMLSIDAAMDSLTYEEIDEATSKDSKLRKFFAVRNSLVQISDVLVYRDKYVIPEILQAKALRATHRGHLRMS